MNRETQTTQMNQPRKIADIMLENGVKHHSEKINNPEAVRMLVNAYLPATLPPGEVAHDPQKRRAEFLAELATLQ